MKTEKNELPTVDKLQEETSGLPVDADLLNEFQQDAGAGLENTGAEDYAIPFISILQKMSPQCDEDKEAYIESARPGMFWDNAAMRILTDDDGEALKTLIVTPVYYERRFNNWRDRDEGGGFLGAYPVGHEIVATAVRDEKGRGKLEDGTYLMDTRQFLTMLYTPDMSAAKPAVFSFASTQIRHGRQWITRISEFRVPGKDGKKFNPPIFAQVWRLGTGVDSNAKGSWKGWRIQEPELVVNPQVYRAAKQLREDCLKGALNIGAPPQGGGEVSDNNDDPPFDGDGDGAAF